MSDLDLGLHNGICAYLLISSTNVHTYETTRARAQRGQKLAVDRS